MCCKNKPVVLAELASLGFLFPGQCFFDSALGAAVEVNVENFGSLLPKN